MQERGFSRPLVLPYKERLVDFVLEWENMGQWKTVFSHILCSENAYFDTNLLLYNTCSRHIIDWAITYRYLELESILLASNKLSIKCITWVVIMILLDEDWSIILESIHCVKSVQIRSFFWSVFFRIRTEYDPEKTLYLDTFHTVIEVNGNV